MVSRTVRIGLGALAGAALAVTGVVSASAHEHRMVAGYSMLVGWSDEPTFTGVRNAVQVFLNDAQGHPVNDLGDSLKLYVVYKDHTSAPQALQPSFDPDTGMGTQGEYDAALVPMKAGTYTFHFTGTIRGVAVDEKFTSSDTTFDNVDDRSSIEFPGGAEKAPKPAAKPAAAPAAAPAPKDAASLGLLAVPLVVLLGGARLARIVRRRHGA